MNLLDTKTNRNLLPEHPLPLFAITLRQVGKADTVTLTAEKGWSTVEMAVENTPATGFGASQLELRWRKPLDSRLGDLRVVAHVTAEPATSSFRWKLKVDQTPADWSLWRVVFPQVALADLGPSSAVFVPKAAGQVERGGLAACLLVHGDISQRLVFDADHGRI